MAESMPSYCLIMAQSWANHGTVMAVLLQVIAESLPSHGQDIGKSLLGTNFKCI